MPRINWRRAVLGGLLAGVVWGTLYAPVHPLVEVHDSLGRPVLPITPYKGDTPAMRVLMVANGLVQGLATVWLYAAMLPRFGPGLKTVAIAGFAVWALVSWVHLMWAAYTAVHFTAFLSPVAANLPLVLLAGMAGARLYKE